MATGNMQRANPGQIQQYRGNAQIADTPDSVVAGGQFAQVMTALGGNVAGRLKQMADRARAKEGVLAGLSSGQAAGIGYLERQASVAAAAPDGELDLRPFLISADRQDHLDGIRPEFRGALARMFAAAPPEFQAQIRLNSGYRSEERQAQLYQEALAKYGSPEAARKWVAPPGKSRHQHGDAYDLQFGSDTAKQWVHANAGQFGLAFPMAHEDWHIELASARGGAAAPVEAAPTGGLNPQPLALRNDNTIYGDAYDAAAIRAYGWRMQQGVSTDIGAAYEQYKDDPVGWQQAVAGIREQYSQDDNFADPRLRDVFDKIFAERTETYSRSVMQRHETRLMAEQAGAFAESFEAMSGDLERQAYLLGANPDAEQILGQQSGRLLAGIAAAEAANIITPSQAAAKRQQLNTTLAYARTNGVFASLTTPAAKQAFANELLSEWAKGKGPVTGLDFQQVKALADQLSAQAVKEQNQLTAAGKVEVARVQGLMEADVASIAATGTPLDTAANDLGPDRLEALGIDPAPWQAARDQARRSWEATAGMELETPAELNDRLLALQPVPGSPDFVVQSEIHAQAVKRAQDVLKERETDPLGQAASAGAIELAPIDFATPDGLAASLALRAQQGNAIAAMYGTPTSYFRPAERASIANSLLDNPQMLPGFALSVSEAFGDGAGKALAELSDAGPELAHVAGLALASGDTSVAAEVAQVLVGRRDKTINVKMPSDAVMSAAAQAVIGPAIGQNPGTRSAVINVAGMLFEGQAARLGFDPADIKDENSAAFFAYQHAVNRALGASQANGEQYGGLVTVNGQLTVAPTQMAAGRVEQLLHAIRPADIERLPAMGSVNGLPIGAGELANGRLLSVGDGEYAVALGDPNSLTPNLVQGPDGQTWILDLYELENLVTSRPMPGGFWGVPDPLGTAGRLFNW